MPSYEKFKAALERQQKRTLPDAMIKWAYHGFKMGWNAGQEKFMQTHDWYE